MSKLSVQPPKAMHDVRPARKAAVRRQVSRARSKAPAKEYAPGYFLVPVLAWKQLDWQRGFWLARGDEFVRRSQPNAPTLNQGRPAVNMTLERERRQREGEGWGAGTVVMNGTPDWRANPLQWINRDLGGKPMR